MNGRRNRRGKRTRRNTGLIKRRNPNTRITSPYVLSSSSEVTRLTFYTQYTLPGGNTSYSYPLHTNGLFDVDPALGGLSVLGFNQWIGFYNYYRVLGYTSKVTFASQEVFGIDSFVLHENTITSVAGGTGSSNLSTLAMKHNNTLKSLSSTLGNRSLVTHTSRIRIDDVVGNDIRSSDNYRGTASTNPADTTFLIFGYKAPTALSNSVVVSVQITFTVVFYDRASLSPVGTPRALREVTTSGEDVLSETTRARARNAPVPSEQLTKGLEKFTQSHKQ